MLNYIDPIDNIWIMQHIKKHIVAGYGEKRIVEATIGYVYDNSGIRLTREMIRSKIQDIREAMRKKKCHSKKATQKNRSARTFRS